MAPPNSVDGSMLGRSVQVRVRFHYQGPVPIDGVELMLNGKVRTKNPQTGEWEYVDQTDRQRCTISFTNRKKSDKSIKRFLTPSYPFRGTGMDAYLNGLDSDLDNVCFYSICCTGYSNQSPHRLSLAHNIGHDYKAYKDVNKEWYQAQVAMGGLPYAFAEFEPNAQRPVKYFALRTAFKQMRASGRQIRYQFTNPAFIASMRFVRGGLQPGDGNVWHGVWAIPQKISDDLGCRVGSQDDWDHYQRVQEARQRLEQAEQAEQEAQNDQTMDTGDDPKEPEDPEGPADMDTSPDDVVATDDDDGDADQRRKDEQLVKSYPEGARPIKCWYAVMRNHPVAWGLEGMYDDQRRGYGVTSSELRVQPAKGSQMPDSTSHRRHYEERVVNGQVQVPDWAPFIYCHVVPDVQVETLMRDLHHTFQDRIDLRVLGHVGFYLGPYRRGQCHMYETQDDGTEMPVLHPQTGEPAWQPLDHVDVGFDVTMHYMVWPKLPKDAVITPQLRHDFPSLQEWVTNPMGNITLEELEMARKRYQQHQRNGRVGK